MYHSAPFPTHRASIIVLTCQTCLWVCGCGCTSFSNPQHVQYASPVFSNTPSWHGFLQTPPFFSNTPSLLFLLLFSNQGNPLPPSTHPCSNPPSPFLFSNPILESSPLSLQCGSVCKDDSPPQLWVSAPHLLQLVQRGESEKKFLDIALSLWYNLVKWTALGKNYKFIFLFTGGCRIITFIIRLKNPTLT